VAKLKKKRIGRPTKPPKEGQRVPLGLRVTAAVKRGLEAAAIKSGRSISQEAELRLEHSLDMRRHLVMAQGNVWSPVAFLDDSMMVPLGDDPRDFPVPPGDPPHEEHWVQLRASPEDLKRLRNYFAGAPYPWTHSNAEIAAAGEGKIKRGK
jgi:hypothetical protein